MLFRQMRYFQTVVEKNSFSEAAEECHISQSAISQQIKALEESLGVTLLKRQNRSFTLTPAGEYFYKRSLILSADLDNLISGTIRTASRDDARLSIGYLKCYGGMEFQEAISAFSQKYPHVELSVLNGNHEDLYDALRLGRADLVLNDQRRAFSDEYVNFELTKAKMYVELSSSHPLAKLSEVEVADLKNTPCILVAGKGQHKNEREFYRNVIGFGGEIIFADSLRDARMLAASGRGFVPVECVREDVYYDRSISRIPLTRGQRPVLRNYCAFWKSDNSGYYVEEFAQLLKEQFL